MDFTQELAKAREALEQKKAEYWMQYGVVLALEKIVREDLDATRNGRAVLHDEPDGSAELNESAQDSESGAA